MTTLKSQEENQKWVKSWRHFGCIRGGVWKKLSIDPFADLDPMLNPENEKSDDYHLLAISNIDADKFETLFNTAI